VNEAQHFKLRGVYEGGEGCASRPSPLESKPAAPHRPGTPHPGASFQPPATAIWMTPQDNQHLCGNRLLKPRRGKTLIGKTLINEALLAKVLAESKCLAESTFFWD